MAVRSAMVAPIDKVLHRRPTLRLFPLACGWPRRCPSIGQRRLDLPAQIQRPERLSDQPVRPPIAADTSKIGVTGDEDDRQIRVGPARQPGEIGAAHACHHDVGQQDIDHAVLIEQLEGVVPAGRLHDGIAQIR